MINPFVLKTLYIIIPKLNMLVINVKDGESIDKALRRYKNKHKKVQLMKQLRGRKHFTKPSVERRAEILKAEYKSKKMDGMA
jgi:small subunit ribosomal protein S21